MNAMDRLSVSIDPDVCACTGYCVEVSPAVFELEGEGPTVVLNPHPPLELADEVREAENLCPASAIRVELLAEPQHEE
jgi:ferredoxin